MLGLSWPTIRTVLCLGAHADDIEIGCGGTLLSLLRQRAELQVTWVVFSAAGLRAEEARASSERYLGHGAAGRVLIQDFRDGFFPYEGQPIKEFFEQLARQAAPDLIFTHYRHDLHQDHRLVSELTWNTFRRHWILEYEVLKYDGDFGTPNLFVPVAADDVARKVERLQSCFASQASKPWFDAEAFRGLMRLRGVECRSPSGFAEAFYARKICMEDK